MRFDGLIKDKYGKVNLIHLDSMIEEFNRYYDAEQGKSKKRVDKMKHYTVQPVKELVKALEASGLLYGRDAAAEVLEFSPDSKIKLLNFLRRIKKKFRKDSSNHDLRLGGEDIDGVYWMFSYWVGPDEPAFLQYFEEWVYKKFEEEKTINKYFAILDCGKNDYQIRRIIYLQR